MMRLPSIKKDVRSAPKGITPLKMDWETSIPITAPWFVTREVNDRDEMESFFIIYF